MKYITKRLSEGDPDVIHRNDEQARRSKSFASKFSRWKKKSVGCTNPVTSSIKPINKTKLVNTLQEAKAQIEALRAEVEN